MFGKVIKKLKNKYNDLSNSKSNAIKDILRKQSILTKLIAMFLILIIVPVLVIGVISTSIASSSMMIKTQDSITASTMQASNYFDLILERAEDLATQIYSNPQVQKLSKDILSDTTDEFTKYSNNMAVSEYLNSISIMNKSVCDVGILLDSGEIIGSISGPYSMDKVNASEWYKKVMDANGVPIWLGDITEGIQDMQNTTAYAASLTRDLRSTLYADHAGIILVSMKYDTFTKQLSSIHLGENDSSYLITDDGKILSAKGEKEDENLSDRPFIKKVLADSKIKDADLFQIKDSKIDYMVSYYKSKRSNWTAITIIPKSEILESSHSIRNQVIFIGVISAIFAAILGFLFSQNIAARLKYIMKSIETAESGDLTVVINIKNKDEIGKLALSFNSMLRKIKDIMAESKMLADRVGGSSDIMAAISTESARASSEVAKTVEEVATGASDQASEVESSTDSVSQLAEKINNAVEGTKVMEEASDNARKLTSRGIQTVDILNRKANETNNITKSVVSEISRLNEYVKSISKITDILKSIADQTNLLALNATIEAARAGEAGKGFAVVAHEVRKLAEQSNSFTVEIKGHLLRITQQMENTNVLVCKAETSTKEQGGLVEETIEVFSNINNSTEILATNIGKIAGIISDIGIYKNLVLSSMENISAVSEETAASTEEVSASIQEQLSSVEELNRISQELNSLSKNMISSLEKFKV